MLRRLYDALAPLRSAWNRFADSAAGQWILKGVRWAFIAGIVGYLAYQLTTIGWQEVGTALPTTPWFYILLLLMYATLPLTEAVLYGTAWSARYRDLLPVLFRKRVLNNDVLGYSGEAYFYFWARRETNLDTGTVLHTVKDNVIISSVTSTTVAFGLLAAFFLTGQIELLRQFLPSEGYTVVGGIAIAIIVVSVGVTFRRSILSLPSSLLWLLGAGHLTRFILNNGFQVLQWAIVIPAVPAGTWITLLTLYIVINQLPFLPARGLLFVSAGVGLSGSLQIPEAPLASMLLAQNLIDRALNFLVYVGTTAAEAVSDDIEDLEELSVPDELQ